MRPNRSGAPGAALFFGFFFGFFFGGCVSLGPWLPLRVTPMRMRTLLAAALLVLVGSGAAKTIKFDWATAAGQTMTVSNWDEIEFTWSGYHNVFLMQDKAAFDACRWNGSTLVAAKSGESIRVSFAGAVADSTMVHMGSAYYFACRVRSNCESGQKLAVAVRGADYPAGLARTIHGRLFNIHSLAVTPDGQTGVVVDQSNIIRRVDLKSRAVSTLAGTANDRCERVDGVGTKAQFCDPKYAQISPDGSTAWVWEDRDVEGVGASFRGTPPRNISMASGRVPASPLNVQCDPISLEECKEYYEALQPPPRNLPWEPPERQPILPQTQLCSGDVPTGCLMSWSSIPSISFNSCPDVGAEVIGGPWMDTGCISHGSGHTQCVRLCAGGLTQTQNGSVVFPWLQNLLRQKYLATRCKMPALAACEHWNSPEYTFQRQTWSSDDTPSQWSDMFSGDERTLNWNTAPQYRSESEGVGVGIVGNRIFTFNLRRPKGSFATLAGFWGGDDEGGYADGVGTNAKFTSPKDLAVTNDGRAVIVADHDKLRRIVIGTGETSTIKRGYVVTNLIPSSYRDPFGREWIFALNSLSYSDFLARVNVETADFEILSARFPNPMSRHLWVAPSFIHFDHNVIQENLVQDLCRTNAHVFNGVCRCNPGLHISPTVMDSSRWNTLKGVRACVPCAKGSYKPSVFDACQACPVGTFSKEGSQWCDRCIRPLAPPQQGTTIGNINSDEICLWPPGFGRVIFDVVMPMTEHDFNSSAQGRFIDSIAEVAGTPSANVTLLNISKFLFTAATRHVTTRALGIQTQVATTRALEQTVKARLSKDAIDAALAKRNLPSTISDVVDFSSDDSWPSVAYETSDAANSSNLHNCTFRSGWLIFENTSSTETGGIYLFNQCVLLPILVFPCLFYGSLVLCCCCCISRCHYQQRKSKCKNLSSEEQSIAESRNGRKLHEETTSFQMKALRAGDDSTGPPKRDLPQLPRVPPKPSYLHRNNIDTDIQLQSDATVDANPASASKYQPHDACCEQDCETVASGDQNVILVRGLRSIAISNPIRLHAKPSPHQLPSRKPATACQDVTDANNFDSAVVNAIVEPAKPMPPPQPASESAQSLWQEVTDENSGSTYYWNTTTNETAWHLPSHLSFAIDPVRANVAAAMSSTTDKRKG